MADGSAKERDFITLLENDFDFAAMRAPASGGATARDLPDVMAMRPLPEHCVSGDTVANFIEAYGGFVPRHSEVWAFEVKYSGRERFYFDREDLDQLQDYGRVAGANVRLACRFNANKTFCYGDTSWYLLRPGDVHTTETKGRVDYEDVKERGESLEEALAEVVP